MKTILQWVGIMLASAVGGCLLFIGSPPGAQIMARHLSCGQPILGPYIVEGQSMLFYDKVCNKEPVPTADFLAERDRKLHEEQVAYHNYLKERAGL